VGATTEAPTLGVRRLRLLLLLTGERAVKNVFLRAAGGRYHRDGARCAIQLITATLRKRQIGEDQGKKKDNHPAM
jgi:hypothetical protein